MTEERKRGKMKRSPGGSFPLRSADAAALLSWSVWQSDRMQRGLLLGSLTVMWAACVCQEA